MEENPNITIEATNLEGGGAARDDAYAKIAANTGLSDVVAIEEGWLGTIQEVSDAFVDLRDYGIEDVKDRWLDWKYEQAHRLRGPRHRRRPRHRPAGHLLPRRPLRRRRPAERARRGRRVPRRRGRDLGPVLRGRPGVRRRQRQGVLAQPALLLELLREPAGRGLLQEGRRDAQHRGQRRARRSTSSKLVEAEMSGLGAGLPGWDVGPEAKEDKFAVYMCPSWMLGIVQGYYDEGTTRQRLGLRRRPPRRLGQLGRRLPRRLRIVGAQGGGGQARPLARRARAAGGIVRGWPAPSRAPLEGQELGRRLHQRRSSTTRRSARSSRAALGRRRRPGQGSGGLEHPGQRLRTGPGPCEPGRDHRRRRGVGRSHRRC